MSAPSQTLALILHPIAWSHYKAAVFAEISSLGHLRDIEIHVAHIAPNERGRSGLGGMDSGAHQYPHSILFQRAYEEIGLIRKCLRLATLVMSRSWDIV